MSLLRFSSVIVRQPLSLRQVFLVRATTAHGFATQKAKPAKGSIPKRPANAFVLFAGENRAFVKEEYPDKLPREISTILSVKWKAMTEDQKKPYRDAYAEKMKVYNAPLQKLPKKPPGMFGLFVKEKFPTFAAGKPGAAAPEIMSDISSEWNSLSDSEKEEWKEKYEGMIQDYKEQVKKFGEELTSEERSFLKAKQGAKMQKLEKEKRELLGYPKKPPSPFIIFMQKNSDGLEDVPVVERTKLLGKKWREMSEDDKGVYFEESRKSREKHQEDVKEWMNKYAQAA